MPIHSKYFKYLASISALIICIIIGLYIYQNQTEQNSLSYNDFINKVEQGDVTQVVLGENQDVLQVHLADSKTTFHVPNSYSEGLFDFLMTHDVEIISDESGNTTTPTQVGLLLIIGVGIFLLYRRKNNSQLVKNSRADEADAVMMLDDIAGNAEAKAMVMDIIQFIKNPDKYADIGARMPRGILFYGPPGTGKTLMAKAIAGEAGVPFYAMSGSDFVQTYVGVGASRIRELFKTAKKVEKAVVFIDEIDAIGKKRSAAPGASNDERDQTLNALLTEMSGFHERDGVVVIAATNRLDTLDEALTRPGRFDRLVEIALPDKNARRRILELHAGSKCISDTVNFDELAKSTVTFSGAMLENLLNEAAIFAANEDVSVIEKRHIDKAFYTVIAGMEKADTSFLSDTDRRITAYHEAGHALTTKLLMPESTVAKVTIIPSTRGAGGFSLSIPKDSLFMTKRNMLANMKVLLAGRASEELIFGADEITTGASNDIEKVSGYMMQFLNNYGMDSDFGIFNSSILNTVPTPEMIELCRTRLNELYEETKAELDANMDLLHMFAAALLEKETLNEQDIDDLFDRRKVS